MCKYLIRSMTTTDFDYRSAKPVTPFHIYLLPAQERTSAYWSSGFRAATFDSPQAAEAEATRLGLDNADIVPMNDTAIPAYWELQAMRRVSK